jgi:hypothetical protein
MIVIMYEYVGQALHNLTPKASTYMAETVLPVLLDKTSSVDLNTRHGAVLAIAEILHALAIVAEQSDSTIQDAIGKLLFFSTFYSIAQALITFCVCLYAVTLLWINAFLTCLPCFIRKDRWMVS